MIYSKAMSETESELDRNELDRRMVGQKRQTLADSVHTRLFEQTCLQVGSQFRIILRPGDNCIGPDGKYLYNKGVTGRSDLSKYPETIRDLTGPEATTMAQDSYFVEYSYGQSGYFDFWKTFGELKSPNLLSGVSR